MANTNNPNGFTPFGHGTSGTPGRGSVYRIASGQSGAIYTGDPVKSTGTGAGIQVAAGGDIVLGVFNGCQYTDTDGSVVYSQYWPSAKTVLSGSETLAWVYDDPMMTFMVQGDGTIAVADIGALADFVVGTGSASTGRSGCQLAIATIAQAGGDNLKILDFVRAPDNAAGANAKVVVLFNQHELKAVIAAGV